MPTATLADPNILDAFPLRQGASWVYNVTLDYAQGTDVVHWTGTISETITSARQQGSGWVLHSQIQGHPLYTAAKGNQERAYIALANRLYRWASGQDASALIMQGGQGFEGYQYLEFPLAIGKEWGDAQSVARGDGWYVWHVEAQEDLTTAAGKFDACYRLIYRTNPDHTNIWFCSGIGIAREEYHHHGSVLDDVWLLQKYVPGK